MATYRKNVETMLHSAQCALDGLSASIRNATMSLYCLQTAVDNGDTLPRHEQVRIHGTMEAEYNHLQQQMAMLEKAMTNLINTMEDKE